MNAFDDACRIEAEGLPDILDFLDVQDDSGRVLLITKGKLARELQLIAGDGLSNRAGKLIAIEWKIEEVNKNGNLFLETWSNRSMFKPGWLVHLQQCDLLLYYFLKNKELYVMNFKKLTEWAFGVGDEPGRIYDYQEKLQTKRSQKNDTWARCVPIDVLRREVGMVGYLLGERCDNGTYPLASFHSPGPTRPGYIEGRNREAVMDDYKQFRSTYRAAK